MCAEFQPELVSPTKGQQLENDLHRFRRYLGEFGWRTRKQISDSFGWSERYIRELAEEMGSEIVRGQSGFKLTVHITRDELSAAVQAADAFLSQGKRMMRYAIALKRKLHQRI